MNKEELIPLAEKLDVEPDKKKRNDIVADFCKEKGLKPGDVREQLKEIAGNLSSNGDQSNGGQDARKEVVLVSHKATHDKYRCAGLVLAKKPANHLVTAGQLAKLRQDPWVVLGGDKPGKGSKPE